MADKRICSVEGCGKPHKAKSLCIAHYERLHKHGNPLGGGTSWGEPERFYREVILPYGGDDCLTTWPFTRDKKGYGQIWVDGSLRYVHRLVCEGVNGPPPTPKHEAAHSCGKGHLGCMTKGHLSWKTRSENEADKLIHGTHNRGERHGMSKLTEADVREIREMKNTEPQQSIAVRYGVSRQTVSIIHCGKGWDHVK